LQASLKQSKRTQIKVYVRTFTSRYINTYKSLFIQQPRTQTPEKIKKFRKSLKEIPGVKQIHPGIYNDPKDWEEMIHGVKTAESDHVNQCIVGNNLSGIKHFVNNIYESKYERNNREPLGKSIIRNYKFPERLKEEEFRFGVPTTGCI